MKGFCIAVEWSGGLVFRCSFHRSRDDERRARLVAELPIAFLYNRRFEEEAVNGSHKSDTNKFFPKVPFGYVDRPTRSVEGSERDASPKWRSVMDAHPQRVIVDSYDHGSGTEGALVYASRPHDCRSVEIMNVGVRMFAHQLCDVMLKCEKAALEVLFLHLAGFFHVVIVMRGERR